MSDRKRNYAKTNKEEKEKALEDLLASQPQKEETSNRVDGNAPEAVDGTSLVSMLIPSKGRLKHIKLFIEDMNVQNANLNISVKDISNKKIEVFQVNKGYTEISEEVILRSGTVLDVFMESDVSEFKATNVYFTANIIN